MAALTDWFKKFCVTSFVMAETSQRFRGRYKGYVKGGKLRLPRIMRDKFPEKKAYLAGEEDGNEVYISVCSTRRSGGQVEAAITNGVISIVGVSREYRKRAGIKYANSKVTIIGYMNRAEIWNRERFRRYVAETTIPAPIHAEILLATLPSGSS